MRKEYWALVALAVIFSFVGLSGQAAPFSTPASTTTQVADTAKPAPQAPPVVPAEPLNYVKAAKDFSNLSLKQIDMPVYDKYTLAERRALQLPTAFKLPPAYKEGKIAYLTFDDGPDDENTIAILDTLAAYKVKGTFYVLGQYAERFPEIIKRMHKEGHAIGSHSYDHDYDDLYSSQKAFLAQIDQGANCIHKIIGVRPLICRAPGGTFDTFPDAFWDNLQDYSYVEHDWNVSIADAEGGHPVAQDFIDNVASQTANGKTSAIVLMHCSAGHEETAKALPAIIELLQSRGYSFGVVTPMTPQPW